MKKTVLLSVAVSTKVDREHLVLHPNEGFDLGLMRLAHPVSLCRNLTIEDFLRGGTGEMEPIQVDLLNECPKETLLLGLGLHRQLGEPKKVIVLFDGDRVYLHRP